MNYKLLTLLSVLLFTAGCQPTLSPRVTYINYSDHYIYNIKTNWNGYYVLGETNLLPGQKASRSFWIDKESDFYGRVQLSWENAAGQQFSEDFIFDEKVYPAARIVELFFTQHKMFMHVDKDKTLSLDEEVKLIRQTSKFYDDFQAAEHERKMATSTEYREKMRLDEVRRQEARAKRKAREAERKRKQEESRNLE